MSLSEEILYQYQIDQYAEIIRDYPINHGECYYLLKEVGKLKEAGFSIEEMLYNMRRG